MEKEEFNFEKELARLKDIVMKIQTNELPLDESIKLYEEGNKIIKELNDELKKAENKVENIVLAIKK